MTAVLANHRSRPFVLYYSKCGSRDRTGRCSCARPEEDQRHGGCVLWWVVR